MVKELATLDEYNAAIKETCVIDFTATWCPPCQMIGPKFVAMAESGDWAGINFYKLDVDANADGAQAAGIQCMPTFKFFKDGAEVHKLEGANEQGIKDGLAKLK